MPVDDPPVSAGQSGDPSPVVRRTRVVRVRYRSAYGRKPLAFTLILITAMLCLIVRALIPLSRTNYETREIWLIHPGLNQALYVVAFGGCLALLGLAGWAQRQNWGPQGCACLLMSGLGLPMAMFFNTFANLGPWGAGNSLIVGTETFTYLERGFLQGQSLAIGRLADSGWIYNCYHMVGETNGDSPRRWIHVVRPAGVDNETYIHLMSSNSGLLLGLRYDNKCFMGYDPARNRFFGHVGMFEDSEDIRDISPFALIGPDDHLHQQDVAWLRQGVLQAKVNGEPLDTGPVNVHTLRQSLKHPNLKVRMLANELLEVLEADQPQALPTAF